MIDLIQFIGKAKFQVQYSDYDNNTWTVAVMLTRERYDRIKNDNSVRKIAIRPIDDKRFIVVEPENNQQ
tara:strand:- start:75 stop:281 length:207 start_codon:yes stop_codon:yes gene_type:complete